jgi:hypothetical protein
MATIQSAQAKWERKMENAGPKWKAGVSGKSDAYARGMAAFGAPVGPLHRSAWESGVASVTDFSSFVRGKGAKWAEKLRAAMAT